MREKGCEEFWRRLLKRTARGSSGMAAMSSWLVESDAGTTTRCWSGIEMIAASVR